MSVHYDKRKHDDPDEEEEENVPDDEDIDMVGGMCLQPIYVSFVTSNKRVEDSLRENALLLQGPPISHLPTARLFAYATHFDSHPLGLEWVDDTTCVFVFGTKAAARTGFRNIQKSPTEEPDTSGFITAKPIPIAVWPPEERISKSLGKGEGLKGVLRMRWAKNDDVKKKGAKSESEFYKKHGTTAGKEVYGQPDAKRRRWEDEESEFDGNGGDLAKRLDNEMDEFIRMRDASEGEEEEVVAEPSSPPSKMRSDYIAPDGRTLLERTSLIRAHPETLASRLTAPLPRRSRDKMGGSLAHRLGDERVESDRSRGKRHGRDGRSERTAERPKKSQQELDDELDAFLKQA